MSTVTFPWQHNGLQALSIQRGKSEFSSIRVFLHQEVLFDLVAHSVGASDYGHYTAQAEESVLNSEALNEVFFILGR